MKLPVQFSERPSSFMVHRLSRERRPKSNRIVGFNLSGWCYEETADKGGVTTDRSLDCLQ